MVWSSHIHLVACPVRDGVSIGAHLYVLNTERLHTSLRVSDRVGKPQAVQAGDLWLVAEMPKGDCS